MLGALVWVRLCFKLGEECFLLNPAVEMSDGNSWDEQLCLASKIHPWCWAACLSCGETEVPTPKFPCCSMDGSGECSASSCGCSQTIPRQLELENPLCCILSEGHSTALSHTGGSEKVPFNWKSQRKRAGGVGLGVEAVCCRCLPWGEAPRPRHRLAQHPPMGRGALWLPPAWLEGNWEFGHIPRPEQIPRISPSAGASAIFLGMRKKNPLQQQPVLCA